MSATFRRVAALTLMGLVAALLTVVPGARGGGSAVASDPGAAPSLFDEATAATSAPLARPKAGVVRSRATAVDAGLFPAKADGQRIRLNFFTDADYTATVTDRTVSGKVTTWSGHVDQALSSFTATQVGDTYVMQVNTLDGVFDLAPGADGRYVARELKPFGRTVNDARVMSPKQVAKLDRPTVAGATVESTAKPAAGVKSGAKGNRATGDTGRIDIVIAYDPTAVAQAGGDPNVVVAQINQAVAEANQAYVNSGIAMVLNPVAVVATPTSGSGSLDTDLDRVTDKGDGFFDELHDVRAQTKADLVALWLGHDPYSDNLCGLAWYLGGDYDPDARVGFSSTSAEAGCRAQFTFAHEVGHNIGAHHDDAPGVQTSPGIDTRAHGWVNLQARWKTIMSYSVQCTNAGFRCADILNFSNPAVLYGGAPTGSAAPNANGTTAQNASTITEVGAGVAGYIQSQIYPAAPIVRGKARLGGKLKLLKGTWVPGSAKVKHRWYVNGKKVKGKKGKKPVFRLTRKQVGKQVSAVITGTAGGYAPVSVTAGPFEVQKKLLRTKTPKLKGKAKVGKRLTVKAGKTKPRGAKVKIRWYNSSGKINGAKKRAYKVRKADAGLGVYAVVTYKKKGYETVRKATATVVIAP